MQKSCSLQEQECCYMDSPFIDSYELRKKEKKLKEENEDSTKITLATAFL